MTLDEIGDELAKLPPDRVPKRADGAACARRGRRGSTPGSRSSSASRSGLTSASAAAASRSTAAGSPAPTIARAGRAPARATGSGRDPRAPSRTGKLPAWRVRAASDPRRRDAARSRTPSARAFQGAARRGDRVLARGDRARAHARRLRRRRHRRHVGPVHAARSRSRAGSRRWPGDRGRRRPDPPPPRAARPDDARPPGGDPRARGGGARRLWASEAGIYGRCGYGERDPCGRHDGPLAARRGWPGPCRTTRPRTASRPTCCPSMRAVYAAATLARPGMIERDEHDWRNF